MARHIFAARLVQPPFPAVGDLIRSTNTGNFINIVLEVGEPLTISAGWHSKQVAREIRSVRYGKTNGSEFLLLNGQRSRQIEYGEITQYNQWQVVDEYVIADNKELRERLVAALKGKNTSWSGPRSNDGEYNDEEPEF